MAADKELEGLIPVGGYISEVMYMGIRQVRKDCFAVPWGPYHILTELKSWCIRRLRRHKEGTMHRSTKAVRGRQVGTDPEFETRYARNPRKVLIPEPMTSASTSIRPITCLWPQT